MLTSKNCFRSITLALAVLSLGGAGPVLRTNVMAMHQHQHGHSFTVPTSPQDPGAPTGRREGGSSRGDKIFTLCKTVEEVATKQCATSRLTALVPEISDDKQIWGLTTADHPEFLFYLSKFRTPKESKTLRLPIEFVLQDDDDRYIYRTRFVLPLKAGGIIRLPIPTTSEPLQVGKRYTWTLYTHFSTNETNYVHGTIYRTQLGAAKQKQLQAASPLKRLDMYLQEGLWFDAMSTLVDLKQETPQDLKVTSRWNNLLKDINLVELATAPMLSCCTPDPQISRK